MRAGWRCFPSGVSKPTGRISPWGATRFVAEKVADMVAELEPVVVLPTLPFTWSPQARRHDGAITIESTHLIGLFEDICDEVGRNGFSKIVLLNGHGGNFPINPLLPMHMVERGKPYVLYSIDPWGGIDKELRAREDKVAPVGHACHIETSTLLFARPDLAKMQNLEGWDWTPRPTPDLGGAHVGVWWIERFPLGVIGRPDLATPELGRELMESWAQGVAEIVRKVKADEVTLRLAREFPRE